MKKTILIAAVAALTLTGVAASAQPYGYQGSYQGAYQSRDDRAWRDSDGDGVSDAREWNQDRDRDGRVDQYDRYDDRRGGQARAYSWGHTWRQGERFSHYNQSQYMIRDYRAYNLAPPRYGYRYYQADNGDVVLAAIASGVIAQIINADRHDNRYDRQDRYDRYDGYSRR